MAEVLGIIASAVQLANYCAGIWNLTQDLRTSTSTLLRYQGLLEELQELSKSIINNEAFHTSDISSLVTSILNTVLTITDLTTLLKRPFIFRALVFLNEKKDIFSAFEVIEKKKSSLSLHMQIIQAEVLHDIRSSLSNMPKLHKQRPSAEKVKKVEKVKTTLLPSANDKASTALTSIQPPALETTHETQVGFYRPARPSTPTFESTSELCLESTIQDWQDYEIVHDNNVLSGRGSEVVGGRFGAQSSQFLDSSTALYFGNKTTKDSTGDRVLGSQLLIKDGETLHLALSKPQPRVKPQHRVRYSRNEHAGSGNHIMGYDVKFIRGAPK